MPLRVAQWILLALPVLVLGCGAARLISGRGWTSTDAMEGLALLWFGLVATACGTAVRAWRAWVVFAAGAAGAAVVAGGMVWDDNVPEAFFAVAIAATAIGHLALLPPNRGAVGRLLRWTAAASIAMLAAGFWPGGGDLSAPVIRIGLARVAATTPAAALLGAVAARRFRHPARPDEFRPSTCPACRTPMTPADRACPECGMWIEATVRSPRCDCGRIPRLAWKVACGACGAPGPRTFDPRGSIFLALAAVLLGATLAYATVHRPEGWFWHIEILAVWWLAAAATVMAVVAARPGGVAAWFARAMLLVAASAGAMVLLELDTEWTAVLWLLAVLPGHGVLLPAIRGDRATTWLRRGAWVMLALVGVGMLASAFGIDDRLFSDREELFDSTLYFVCLAAALLSMAAAPLAALRTPRPLPLTATVACPCCASTIDAPASPSRCPVCSLEFELTLTEHRCACGYLLSKLQSDLCPECGRPARDAVPALGVAV